MDCAVGQSSCIGGTSQFDPKNEDLIKFTCFLCGLTENCRYGLVEVSSRKLIYRYKDEMYYMLDPFRNRRSVNERLLTRTKGDTGSKIIGSKTTNIFDILVLGAICSICGQPVCISEDCSVFYAKTFCVLCVTRERIHFPKTFVQQIDISRQQRKSKWKEDQASL